MKASPMVWTGRVLTARFALFMLGAVLMIGLLGAAMATQVRVDSPLISHPLLSLCPGQFMWGGLRWRDPEVRALSPFRRRNPA